MLPSRMRVTFAFHDNLTNTEEAVEQLEFSSASSCFVSLVDLSEENWTAVVIKVYTTVLKN